MQNHAVIQFALYGYSPLPADFDIAKHPTQGCSTSKTCSSGTGPPAGPDLCVLKRFGRNSQSTDPAHGRQAILISMLRPVQGLAHGSKAWLPSACIS